MLLSERWYIQLICMCAWNLRRINRTNSRLQIGCIRALYTYTHRHIRRQMRTKWTSRVLSSEEWRWSNDVDDEILPSSPFGDCMWDIDLHLIANTLVIHKRTHICTYHTHKQSHQHTAVIFCKPGIKRSTCTKNDNKIRIRIRMRTERALKRLSNAG